MKNDLITLSAGVALVLLTGCAATGTRYSSNGSNEASYAASTLSSSPVTSPEELVRWTQFFPNYRSGGFMKGTETYTFAVPVDYSGTDAPAFSESLPPGSVFTEAAGGETRTYRLIRHTPNQR